MTTNATKNSICLVRVAVLHSLAAAKHPGDVMRTYRAQLAWNEAAHLIASVRAAR